MSRDKAKKDVISEQEYNSQMASASTSPEEDSPADSESDAGAEFLMGLNYMPNEKNDVESDSDDELEAVDDSLVKETGIDSAEEAANQGSKPMVVSSDSPAPWMDLDSTSDTH